MHDLDCLPFSRFILSESNFRSNVVFVAKRVKYLFEGVWFWLNRSYYQTTTPESLKFYFFLQNTVVDNSNSQGDKVSKRPCLGNTLSLPPASIAQNNLVNSETKVASDKQIAFPTLIITSPTNTIEHSNSYDMGDSVSDTKYRVLSFCSLLLHKSYNLHNSQMKLATDIQSSLWCCIFQPKTKYFWEVDRAINSHLTYLYIYK